MWKLIVGSALVAALAAVAGIAYATVPDETGVIHGCRHHESGNLRVIESGECRQRTPKSSKLKTPNSNAKNRKRLYWVQSVGHETFINIPFTPAVEITAVGPSARQHVLTLDLPAGAWHVTTSLTAEKSSGDGILDCATFTSPSFATAVLRASMGTDPGSVKLVTLSGSGLVELPEGGQAELKCRQRAGATGANPVIQTAGSAAIRIGAIKQAVGG